MEPQPSPRSSSAPPSVGPPKRRAETVPAAPAAAPRAAPELGAAPGVEGSLDERQAAALAEVVRIRDERKPEGPPKLIVTALAALLLLIVALGLLALIAA